MSEAISRLRQQLTDFWKNLDESQKKRIYITSTLLILAFTLGIIMLTRTTYITLMTIDDSRDLAEIEKALNDKNIRYKPGDRGQILVDSKDKNKAEFALASSGLTGSGMTFEDTWNLINISSTESDKKHLWHNFKTKSIIAKLKMFDNIKDADVELTVPDSSMFFVENKEEAKASVRINPKGEITPEQVEGIARVVASSIEGLKLENVTVVDNNFNILSQDSSNAMNIPAGQYKLKLRIKEELERNIKELYSGRSNSYDFISVVVNPVLDLDKVTTNTKEITKPTGLDEAVVSEERHKEELENGSMEGRAPGMDANPGDGNVPGYPITGEQGSSYKSNSEIINRLFSETLTAQEKAIGTMNFEQSSMTVALWYGDRVPDDSSLTQEFIDQFKQSLSNATGIPIAKISVDKQKLAPAQEYIVSAWERIKAFLDEYGFFALMIILVIALMLALIPRKGEGYQTGMEPQLATAGGIGVSDDLDEEIQKISYEEQSEVKKQIEKFVKEKPESVAQLLRNWLSDEWD